MPKIYLAILLGLFVLASTLDYKYHDEYYAQSSMADYPLESWGEYADTCEETDHPETIPMCVTWVEEHHHELTPEEAGVIDNIYGI